MTILYMFIILTQGVSSSFTRADMVDAVAFLSDGYNEDNRIRWSAAFMTLFGLTSEAVKSRDMEIHVLRGLNISGRRRHPVSDRQKKINNSWSKISKHIRTGDYSFDLVYNNGIAVVTERVTRYSAGSILALINTKDGSKKEKVQRKKEKHKRIRKDDDRDDDPHEEGRRKKRKVQKLDCGGGYRKLHSGKVDQKKLGGDTPYSIMFGLDIRGYSTDKVLASLTYNDTNHLIKKDVPCETDQLSHVYTCILSSGATYNILIDNVEKQTGSLYSDRDLLPPKKMKDPEAKKPEDWEDKEFIPDPKDKKPEGYDDIPKEIQDADAKKPEDWDNEEDGEWTRPAVPNSQYKGPWPLKVKGNESTDDENTDGTKDLKMCKPSIIPAVEIDPSGCSFNPSSESHQDALALAVADEMQKIYQTELGPKPVPLTVPGEAVNEEDMYFLDADNGSDDDDGLNEIPDGDADLEGENKSTKPKRVTRVQLIKRARHHEQLKKKTEAQKVELLSKEIDSLPDIMKEIAKEDEEKQKRHDRRRVSKQERLETRPPRFGKHKFVPAPAQVLLSEEITGSLRKLKGCCTLARDRFKSFEKRGLIVPTAKSSRRREIRNFTADEPSNMLGESEEPSNTLGEAEEPSVLIEAAI